MNHVLTVVAMADTMNTISYVLQHLRLGTDHVRHLKELKAILSTVHPSELEHYSQNLPLAALFDTLNSSNRQEAELGCDILPQLLVSLRPSVVLTQYNVELLRGLSHANANVKELTLKQILRCAREDSSRCVLASNLGMIFAIVDLIADEDMSVCRLASDILTHLTTSKLGLDITLSSSVISHMKDIMSRNDIIRFRVYEVIVNIARHSEDALQRSISSGMLSHLVAEMQSSDILLQLNCLELLSELAVTPHGLHYLQSLGIVSKLEKMLNPMDSNPLMKFLLPGLIKFFGNIGHMYPKEVCDHYPGFVNCVLNTLKDNDPVLKGIAIETIGVIGSSMDGKLALDKLGERMQECVKCLGDAIYNAPSEIRTKALASVESLIDLKVSEQTSELLALTESWFCQLSPRPFEIILNLCHQPFVDLRCAALCVLQVLSRQPWGQHRFNENPGFLEYLLDRTTEPDKEGKELKYEVVRTLAESPTAQEILGRVTLLKLKQYVKEGPFYVRAQAEVAIEGAL